MHRVPGRMAEVAAPGMGVRHLFQSVKYTVRTYSVVKSVRKYSVQCPGVLCRSAGITGISMARHDMRMRPNSAGQTDVFHEISNVTVSHPILIASAGQAAALPVWSQINVIAVLISRPGARQCLPSLPVRF